MPHVEVDGLPYRPVDVEKARELAERLREFRLEATTFWRERFIEWDEGSGMYDDDRDGEGHGDEFAPFFSEAFLYNLVGRDEARSILGIIRGLCDLAEVEYR